MTKAELIRMWFNFVRHRPHQAVRTYQTGQPVAPYPWPRDAAVWVRGELIQRGAPWPSPVRPL